MTSTAWIVLACFIGTAGPAGAQQSSADQLRSNCSSQDDADASEHCVSLKSLAPDILRQQKPIWTFPLKVARGEHWKSFFGVALGTAALVIADPYTEPYFRNNHRFTTYKTGPLRGRNTTLAITLTPVAFYLTGMAKHSKHTQSTALLAAEAIADTQILSLVMKHIAGRLEPSQIPPNGNFRDTWLKYKGSFTNGGSFPSGHAASAFAVATVIADQYRQHRWVPWVCYGTATFLALTRLPDLAHFPSDIFFGGVMGYTISHFVVLGR